MESLFAPVPVPEDLRQAWENKGWPPELLQRAAELRVPRSQMEMALAQGAPPFFKRVLDGRERLMFGTLRLRAATIADAEALADCHAHSPEDLGEWEVTVERSPRPFAQFRLQEGACISVLEDRGVILATTTYAIRKTVVGGKWVVVNCDQALRIRRECRGQGLSDLVRGLAPPAATVPPPRRVGYFYIRSENLASFSFFQHTNRERLSTTRPPGSPEPPPVAGTPVTVLSYGRRPFDGDGQGIRKARHSDIRHCVPLINRTHRGLDLFRPFSAEYLRDRLDESRPGEKSPAWLAAHSVYGWQDYYVLEEDGRIVACAGLWDRGRDIREVWRHKTTGEQHTVTSTAVLDFGYAEGREEAMARLVSYLIGETDRLGRDSLTIPLENLPALAKLLEGYGPAPETRGMEGGTFDAETRRPFGRSIYTDLRYW